MGVSDPDRLEHVMLAQLEGWLASSHTKPNILVLVRGNKFIGTWLSSKNRVYVREDITYSKRFTCPKVSGVYQKTNTEFIDHVKQFSKIQTN